MREIWPIVIGMIVAQYAITFSPLREAMSLPDLTIIHTEIRLLEVLLIEIGLIVSSEQTMTQPMSVHRASV